MAPKYIMTFQNEKILNIFYEEIKNSKDFSVKKSDDPKNLMIFIENSIKDQEFFKYLKKGSQPWEDYCSIIPYITEK